MILSAQPFHLYYIEGSLSKAKKIVRSRVSTLTPFFRSLYNRLSRLFAITFTLLFRPSIYLLALSISCNSQDCQNSVPY